MKKTIIILVLPILLASCGSNNQRSNKSADTTNGNQPALKENSKTTQDTTPVPKSAAENVAKISIATSSDKGAQLIVKNDCRNCHREREKLIGPAFSDIAKRYTTKDIDSLVNKIIKGGSGHWGDVGMSAHPSLSQNDAQDIVRFILKFNE